MFEYIKQLLESDNLSPHGICLLWRPELLWTHVISDLVIGTAYFSIPIVLSVFVAKRPDLIYGWVVWAFAIFIVACGTTHYFSIWTLWFPDYGIEALIKSFTAVASVATAVALWPLLPKALARPSTAQLAAANKRLELLVHERDAALEALRALTTTDELTGIGNRRAFNERLKLEWARGGRYSMPLALITLDVDRFKQYNDHFGHGAGDKCLKQVAEIMGDHRRVTDLPSRVGGEEFSILLPDTTLAGALVVAEQIRARLQALRIKHPKTIKGYVTASIGVAVAIPNNTITAENLLQAADQALYEAKRGGRDQVVSVAPLSEHRILAEVA